MVTIKDIAQVVGVSPTTVSNVINGKSGRVSADTVARINTAIEELGYVPNMSARSLVSRSSKVIGFVNHIVTDKGSNFMEDPFLSKFIGILEHVLRENGYYLLLRTVETAEQLQFFLHTWDIDGLFLAGIFKDEFFDEISTLKIPIVLVDSYVHHKGICNVGLDDFGGSNSSTKYLIQNGHKKIAFASLHIKDGGVLMERFLGYKAALTEAGIPFDESLVFECGMDLKGTRAIAKTLASHPEITGVVTTADTLAGSIIANLHKLKIKIPEQVSVVGFDDLSICNIIEPPLTSIHQDMDLKGRIAVDFMLQLLEHKKPKQYEVLLHTSITERNSVRTIS